MNQRNEPTEKQVAEAEQIPPTKSKIFQSYAKEIEGLRLGDKTLSLPPTTLVIARYKEDLSWLLKTPNDIQITVYNKGPEITDLRVSKRIGEIIRLRNVGREADTYLNHLLQNQGKVDARGWTIFCQGDPFTHSTDFLKLLQPQCRSQWKDIQCLTWGYDFRHDVPHRVVMDTQKAEWIGKARVFSQVFWTYDLDLPHMVDRWMMKVTEDYRRYHKLGMGWNVTAHFLEQCGLPELARTAWEGELGRMAYGAIFAVRNERLDFLPKVSLEKMIELARGHYSHGFFYERLWLNLFGLPFVKVSAHVANKELLPIDFSTVWNESDHHRQWDVWSHCGPAFAGVWIRCGNLRGARSSGG